MRKLTTASLLAASFAFPAMAQTSSSSNHSNAAHPNAAHPNAAMNAPATHDTAGNPTGNGYNTPSDRNSAMTDHGGVRASKVIGSSVYNDKDQKIGSVDDLVIGTDQSLHAVIDVGGILGVGGRMVEVPYNKLQFGNVKGSSDNKIVMPGATKDALNAMPAYHFANNG